MINSVYLKELADSITEDLELIKKESDGRIFEDYPYTIHIFELALLKLETLTFYINQFYGGRTH